LRGPHDPVLTDFGLALHLGRRDAQIPEPGTIVGTLPYVAPEQLRMMASEPPGVGSDLYGLGALLYELLVGQPPFLSTDWDELLERIIKEAPVPPSQRVAGIPAVVDALCLKALAKDPHDRYLTATALAAALGDVCTKRPNDGAALAQPRQPLRRDQIVFDFICPSDPVPAAIRNTVYLDVGNDVRAGVIDHHCATAASASTTRLVLHEPKCIDAVLTADFQGNDCFRLVMHDAPDLDCVAAAYLVIEYLTTGQFPPGAAFLVNYVDAIDRGESWLALDQPFTLYAAFVALINRPHDAAVAEIERWRSDVAAGVELARFALQQSMQQGVPLDRVDAFACPALAGMLDRQIVLDDIQRYQSKLAQPATHARVAQLCLPGQCGGLVQVPTLLVRGVQDRDDPERVALFKDWARSDRQRAPDTGGFVGLSVYMSETANKTRRCILSLRPDSRATLRGLAAQLEAAESRARIAKNRFDDRVIDPQTRLPLPPRQGYDNSDPWYDGRGHRYTIVDAPAQGTVLSAEQIEQIFLDFGDATGVSITVPNP
jgi:Protein kinase domain